MLGYRAYLLDRNGRVIKRHDFECLDDTEAVVTTPAVTSMVMTLRSGSLIAW